MPASIEEIFTRLETEWMNAWKNKDEPTARKIVADEFTLASSLSGGKLVTREEWMEKAMHHYDCKSFTIESLRVTLYENTAVVNLWFWQDATANGKDWSGNFLLTDVWIKRNQDWQVLARHSSWLAKTQ